MFKEDIRKNFALAKSKGRLALVPFLTAGIPSKKEFPEQLKILDQEGSDLIEIGVPFSDPVADGPTIEAASLKALQEGVNLDYIFKVLSEQSLQAKVILMGYFNPFYQYGLDRLLAACEQYKIAGLIIPDLPLEEYLKHFPQPSSINYIPLIGLNTSKKRMQEYAKLDPAFVYMVSVLGITGSKVDIQSRLIEQLKIAREVFTCPLVLGFGLSSLSQLEKIEDYLDGVVFGSALIKYLEETGSVAGFLQKWQK
ncbi:MAG: tryptophan synthase alpha chain [Desulfonauticus sp.]|jgi:tryptophan synthase alpha chain|nr:tryptophan synthase alpha chain [Desulfonauticus sp.]